MVLFIIITASILVLTVAGIALSQTTVASRTLERNDALEAAEAGLDAAVGMIRAANDGDGNGVLADLPCSSSTVPNYTMSGSVNAGQAATYNVSVDYLTADPTGNATNTTWLNNNDTGCTGTEPSKTPSYALLQATARDPSNGPMAVASRSLDETYYFFTSNANISGGLIYDYQSSYCLADDDISGRPATNDPLVMEPCQKGSPEQTWAFRNDFTLVLTSTESATAPGLCITESSWATASLQNCTDGDEESSPSSVSYTQQWGVNDNGDFAAVASSGGGPSGYCLATENSPPQQGDTVNLASCLNGFTDSQTWYPTAQVGAGDSGPATNQFVNFDEFGRCIDVTNQDPTDGYPQGAGTGGFMIDYMCKQFPDTNDIAWNQKFNMVSVNYTNGQGVVESMVELQTTDGGTTYCLDSPLTPVSLPATHAWVETEPCNTATKANIVWTNDDYATGDPITDWTLEDSAGYCLEADTADPQQPGGNGDAFTTIAVDTCTGATNQKWNAPPTLDSSGVNNTFEPTVAAG